MAGFSLSVLDARDGRVFALRLDAASEQDARALAEARDLAVLACEAVATSSSEARSPSRWNVAEWAKELGTLLRSGMTVVEALDTLRAQGTDAKRREVLGALLHALESGRTLSNAMDEAGAFPPILVAGVRAGERTSNLREALEDYLRYDSLLGGLKRKVISSALYPAIVAGVGLTVTLFLLVFVIPRFATLYQQGSEPGVVTALMLNVSSLLTNQLPALLMLGAGFAATGAWAWQTGALTGFAARVAGAIPVLQHLRTEFMLARLYQSLRLMVRGGYTLSEALVHCAALEPTSPLAAGLRRVEAQLLKGTGVAAGLAEEGMADATDRRLLAVGERSGNFDEVLQTISERHAERFSTGIERVTRLVEPAMLLGVSLLVGGIVVLMYMPVFDIAAGIR